jgi:hypothetical protein
MQVPRHIGAGGLHWGSRLQVRKLLRYARFLEGVSAALPCTDADLKLTFV